MSNDAPVFPPDCEADFIGEGAANLVFDVRLPGGEPAFPGNLLRVPKAGTSAFSHKELQEYWETTIAPLFGDDELVKQSLIPLTGSGIVPKLNAILAGNEAARRQDFRGSAVADADYGMLVEDMRKQQATDRVMEFKPKWLSQSPSAPPKAIRCRNCARQAYGANKDGKTLGSEGRSRPLCPLKLIRCRGDKCHHGDEQAATCEFCTIIETLLPSEVGVPERVHDTYKRQLARWIRTNGLLPRLQRLQADAEDLELAMTLRDCTCFLRIPADDTSRGIEAKLGDLDRKNGEAKREYWANLERKLAQGGYYHGTESPRQKTACWLERQ
ncbi:inositol-pentakisphosphate 2-kinase [Coniochaeta sp. 2T2.1]|nr:inositol-pentakisphosphate 2-kinase [Coniochaeta sp. 2T2.1]